MHKHLPSDFTWYPDVCDPDASAELLAALIDETPWEDHTFRMMGREIPMPRRIAFYGTFAYAYSGVTHPARPLTERLDALRARVEQVSGHTFNCLLLNLYRGGQDSVGWHSDDDYACGHHPAVASLSFGATRRFRIRSKATPRETFAIDLTPGGVLVMSGRSQIDWQHSVPKTKRAVGARVNLTFRYMAGSN